MIESLEKLSKMLVAFREKKQTLRGKPIKHVALVLHEDYSGLLTADLWHGKIDVDAPHEACDCVFRGPEELIAILRCQQDGDWYTLDELPSEE